MRIAMRVTSIAMALLLGLEPGWSAAEQQDSATPPRTNVPPALTGTQTPTRGNTGTGIRPTFPVRGGRAPDGHTYTPPTSIANVPKGHPTETYTGRQPAGPRGGGGPSGGLIGGAAAAGGIIALGTFLHARNQPAPKLSREGPKTPDQYSMSNFSIGAFVQANWPVVVDHVLSNGGELTIVITAQGFPTFRYRIRATGRRQQEIFRLPAYFPAQPTPGMYTISATNTTPGVATPVYMRLFGMGAGERAVGSVAIDQVKFGPDTIHPKQKQEATYAFHAHTDFDRVRAEFMKAVTEQGQIVAKLEDHADINGVQRETTPSREWNGKKASPGEHLLQVRAWESVLAKSNWVIAWSADQVSVEE